MPLGTPTMGAIAYSAQNNGNVSPAYPAGLVSGDLIIAVIGSKPSVVNTGNQIVAVSGWQLVNASSPGVGSGGYGTTLGADTGNTGLYVFRRTSNGTETGNFTFTLNNNNIAWAAMIRVPGGGSAVSFTSFASQSTTPTASLSMTHVNTNTYGIGDVFINAFVIPTDVLNNGFSTLSTTLPGFVISTSSSQLGQADSSVGNDIGGYLGYTLVTEGSGSGSLVTTGTITGTLTNVRGPFYSIIVRDTATYLTQDATYTNTQIFNENILTPGAVNLQPALYTNDNNVFTPTVASVAPATNLTPDLYTNNQSYFTQTVAAAYALTPARYDNAQEFFAPTVTAGAVSLQPQLYTNTQSYFTQTVSASYQLTPNRFDNLQAYFDPTVAATANLQPQLYTNDQAYFAQSVAASYTVAPNRYDNAQAYYGVTLSVTYNLSPNLYSNTQDYFAPQVSTANEIAPNFYTNTSVFYSPLIEAGGGAQNVAPNLYANESQFFTATVGAGAVSVTPSLYTNTQNYFTQSLSAFYSLTPNLYTNTQTYYNQQAQSAYSLSVGYYQNTQVFFSPTVETSAPSIQPNLYTNTQLFYAPSVIPGVVNLAPELYTNSSEFFQATESGVDLISFEEYVANGYSQFGYVAPYGFNTNQFFRPAVTPGAVVIAPNLYTNTVGYYQQVVGFSSYKITAEQARLLFQIYLLHGLDDPLIVSPTSRVAGPISQTVSDVAGVVSVTTTAQAAATLYEPSLMIEELAALHGLGVPLVVDGITRVAGSINQNITTVGTTTTVTRQ